MDTSTPFKWRHDQAEIIVLCMRWSLRYALSYRDLEEMRRERGHAARSQHDLPLGAALCPRDRQTLSASSQSLQRFLESG